MQFITTTKHILYLHSIGMSSNDIVNVISVEWNINLMRANVMVAYELDKLEGEIR